MDEFSLMCSFVIVCGKFRHSGLNESEILENVNNILEIYGIEPPYSKMEEKSILDIAENEARLGNSKEKDRDYYLSLMKTTTNKIKDIRSARLKGEK